MTLNGEADVKRPSTTPLTSSVLDHAQAAGNVHKVTNFGMRNEAGLWPSYNCLDLLKPVAICEPVPSSGKEFDVAEWQPAFSFALYGGTKCSAVGLDMDDQKAETERVFEWSQGKGIERALKDVRFVATDSDQVDIMGNAQVWDAPVDLTPASAVTLQQAVSILEGYAAAHYVGIPTLHMPRAAAELLGDRVIWKGDLAFTRLGSKIAMGGGYDDDAVPISGEWDLYATGEVYIEMSDEITVQTFTGPSATQHDGTGGTPDIQHNMSIAMAERMFRASVDCFVAQITATVFA